MPYKNREQQLNYLKAWRAKQKGKKPVKKETFEGGNITRQEERKPTIYVKGKMLEGKEAETEADRAFEEALARIQAEEETEDEEENEDEDETEDEEPQQKALDIQRMFRQSDAIQAIPSKYFHTPHGTIINMIDDILPHIDSWGLEKIIKLVDETFTDNELFIKRCYFLHLLNGVDTRRINKSLPNHIRKEGAYQSSYTRKRLTW